MEKNKQSRRKKGVKGDREEARKEVQHLFSLAESFFARDPRHADEYVAKARRIAMKHRLRLPRELKRSFCSHCYRFLRPGVNLRVRTKDNKVVYTCLVCKQHMRFML